MTGTRFWLRSLLSVSVFVGCSASGQRDAAITERVRSLMEADRGVQGVNLSITTREGVVTLEGEVQDELTRQRAIEIARRTAGVVQVVDRLWTPPVSLPAVVPREVPRAARATLATSRPEPPAPTAVDPVLIPVRTGEIDLAAPAQTPAAEPGAATGEPLPEWEPPTGNGPMSEAADITHAPPTFDFYPAGSAEDAAISAGVRAKVDEVVSSGRVQILTRRGVVTLSGVVDTELEKSQALRSARGVPGVERVEDRLLVLRP